MSLNEMNKQMKINVNEASGISDKCKRKLIQLVEKHFYVKLPKENFLNIDIEVLENSNIKMRDEEYQSSNPTTSLEALKERFNVFQEEVNNLLQKNEVNFDTLTARKERNNLIWIFFITFAIIIIVLNAIKQLFAGNYYGVLWIIIIIGYYVIPATGNSIRNRYIRALNYLKSIIYKNKK